MTISPASSPTGRPRSNSYSSSVKELHIGTKVRIIETENVMQRARHLIGKVGTICEVPVHPATWFKVEFPDGTITTFRPSAFAIVGSDYDAIEALDLPNNISLTQPYMRFPSMVKLKKSNVPNLKSTRSSGRVTDFHEQDTNDEESLHDNETLSTHSDIIPADEASVSGTSANDLNASNKQKPLILDALDPENWVGCKVKIIAGKNLSEEGKVSRTGNGWVQILTANGEEVAKRAHELEVLSLPSGVVRPTNATRHPSSSNPRRKSLSTNSENGPSMVDYDRPRPRRLMKKTFDIDGNSIPMVTEGGHYDDGENDRGYFYEMMKEFKKTIHIDENFTCWGVSTADVIHETVCRECSMEKWQGSSLCWNEECPLSPCYTKTTVTPMKKTSLISSPREKRQFTADPTFSTSENSNSKGIYDSSNVSAKKRRSDSSMTDMESPSPELTAQRIDGKLTMGNIFSEFNQSTTMPIVLPSNPTLSGIDSSGQGMFTHPSTNSKFFASNSTSLLANHSYMPFGFMNTVISNIMEKTNPSRQFTKPKSSSDM